MKRQGLYMDVDGNKSWFKDGLLHRENDLPAEINHDGTRSWYINGDFHRDNDKPAIIWSHGIREWYRHGQLHRVGNPAATDLPSNSFFVLEGISYSEEDYWKEVGKTYGLVIRDKTKI